MSTDKCNAWLLPIADDSYAATGEFELVHVIMDWVRLFSVPKAPPYCKNLFIWQGQLIPLFDMETYIQQSGERQQDSVRNAGYICIVAYQSEVEDGDVKYGGLLLKAMPYRTTVGDEQACGFPEGNMDWANIALSCFEDPALGAVPILDLAKIFSSRPDSLQRAA